MCPLPRPHAHMVPDGTAIEFVPKALRAHEMCSKAVRQGSGPCSGCRKQGGWYLWAESIENIEPRP